MSKSQNIFVRKYLLAFAILLMMVSCRSNQEKHEDSVNTLLLNSIKDLKPIVEIEGAFLALDKKRHDFGCVSRKKTPKLDIEFETTNTGKKPLIILHADVSCRCLSVEYAQKPLMPGEKSRITVSVDIRAEEGIFSKAVFLKSTAENDIELIRISGKVRR